MSKLNSAIKLADMGFYIFPLRENSKLPLIKDFPNKATRSVEQITAWWKDPVMELEHDYNIGISTSTFGDNEALIVIDVDNKGEKKGSEVLEELDMLGKESPFTSTQTTPTNGKHLIYRHTEALKQGVNVLGKGLDIRSKGGYIVGAGSTIDGKYYRVESLKTPTIAPTWLVDQLGKAPEREEQIDLTNSLPSAIERAIFYLQNEAPESLKGDGGDATAYKVAAMVKDFGVAKSDCLELMMEHWFNGSGWSPEKLQAKINHAYEYGVDTAGSAAPEKQFDAIPKSEETLNYLEQMNKEYALIFLKGSHYILHETVDEKGIDSVDFLTEQTFKRKFSPFSLQKRGTYATEWLDWTKRREYSGVCFAPEREARNGYYNLWKGFICEPLAYENANEDQKRGFDLFISHVKENICNRDEKLANWVFGYFAHMIQKPFERPLTTLVFRGGKGVGKNAMIDRIGNLLGGEHFIVAHDDRYLISNFNGHMDSCLCLVLDEAFWSGDKSAEGKLKGITTSPTIRIERKGKESYVVDNLARLIIIGNEKWLVPASNDERRYAVLDVGDGRKQDTKFFHDMRVLIDEKGGNQVLLHFLKTFDLKNIDVNIAPKTQGLLDQKSASLPPLESWWFDCLSSGKIVNHEFGDEWPEKVDKSSLRQAFSRAIREMNVRTRLPNESAFGKALREFAPSVFSKQRRDGENRVWMYRLPTLEDARKEWETYIGQEVIWE